MDGGERFEQRLADARAGHAPAWVALYDAMAPIVHAYLRAQSLQDPEDVASETFLQVVRDLRRFTGTERQFRSWVLTIAHHRMLDAQRSRQRHPARPMATEDLPHPADGDVTADDVLASSEWLAVRDMLAHLTEEQREVVVLRVVNELSIDETADVLGRSVGSVKSLQHRAFRVLRAHLANTRNPVALSNAHPVWPS